MPLDTSVVLAGREDAARELRRLCNVGGTVTVGWEAPHEEIVAFVAAALADSSGGPESLYVQGLDVARRLLAPSGRRTAATGLIVVAASADLATRLVPRAPRCLVVPVASSQQADVVCGPVDSRAVAERLRIHGIDHDAAGVLGQLGRRSLLALRREMAVRRELHLPGWAGEVDAMLRRCLLLNRWDRSSAGDIEVVSCFVGKPYSWVEERLEQLGGHDPPFLRTGSVWHAVSASEAWIIAGNRLRDEELDEFAAIVVDVLVEPDRPYGVEVMEHTGAEQEGVATGRSRRLKEGLAASLAALATAGDQVPARTHHVVEDAVSRLLALANSDVSLQRWGTVAPWLPLLAEAAPRAVLSAVRSGLAHDQPLAAARSSRLPNDAFGIPRSVPVHHLLDALDVLSWSPDHLAEAAMLLARLQELDPAVVFGQQPVDVLKDIMCPWMPNTAATVDGRLEVLDMLRHRHPEVAWEVMLPMLPDGRESKSDGATPRYRDWKDHQKPVTNGEYYDIVEAVGAKLIADAAEAGRWAALVDRCGDMLPQTRTALIRELGRIARGADEATRKTVWPAMRAMVANHREFSDTRWALSSSEIAQFESLMEPLRPESLAETHGWLFCARAPSMPGIGPREDWKKRGAVADQQRTEVVREIVDAGGIDAAVAFAASVKSKTLVGEALARAVSRDAEGAMLAHLVRPERAASDTARGYFHTRFESEGWKLFDALIAGHTPPPSVVAELLRTSWDPKSVWGRLEALGADVAAEYWERFTQWDLSHADLLAPAAARRLAAAGRTDSAAELLARFDYQIRNCEYAHAAAEVLTQCTQRAGGAADGLTSDVLAVLLEALSEHADCIGVQHVAAIEWEFLPALRVATDTPSLHRALADDPDFFATIAEVAYSAARPPDNGDPADAEPGRQGRQRQSAAHNLLRQWPRSPGLDTSGNIDPRKLLRWIERARMRNAEIGISTSGDVAIGAALAAAPADLDGNSPNSAVCDLLEEVASDDLDYGFSNALLTSRCGTETSLSEGGDRDRELAVKHQRNSERLTAQCHYRAAAIFADLADHHNRCAIVHDRMAEERQVGLAS